MLKTLNSFTPNFLKKIDKHLLLNYPDIWAAKVHHVAFWGSIYFLLLTGIAWTYPLATDNVPKMESVFLIAMLPAAIAVLYWVYQLSLFRIEKNFGLSNSETRFRTQILYVIVIAFLGISPYYYSSILHSRIGDLVSIKTMKQDLKNLEVFDRFIKDIPYQYNNDMLISLDTSALYTTAKSYNEIISIPIPYFLTEEFSPELQNIKTPEYSDQILLAMAEKAFHSFNKYSPKKITDFQLNGDQNSLFTSDYDLKNKCEQNVHTILYAQYGSGFFGDDNTFSTIWTWFLLALSLVLFIFMRVEVKTFLMAAVSGFVLMGGIALSAEMSRPVLGISGRETDTLILIMYSFLLVCLGAISFSTRNTQRFAVVRQISLILLSIGIIFEPLLLALNFERDSVKGDEAGFLVLIASTFFAWGMWNLLFAGKMRHLYSNPMQN